LGLQNTIEEKSHPTVLFRFVEALWQAGDPPTFLAHTQGLLATVSGVCYI
jgi:hypothetical protein